MSSKKTPPRPDAAYFLDIQPRLSERAHSISESLLASGLLPQGCCSRRANQRVCSPPQWFHSSIVTAPIGSLKLTSIPVAQLHRWQRMVLSEARGLRLFSVVQGGIGLHRRLGAEGKNEASQCYWILSLEPERLKEPDSLPVRNDPGTDRTPLAKTLKLLVVLNGWRRSVPPSSKRST